MHAKTGLVDYARFLAIEKLGDDFPEDTIPAIIESIPMVKDAIGNRLIPEFFFRGWIEGVQDVWGDLKEAV